MTHDYTLSAASVSWWQTVALLDRLFPPPRAFSMYLWDGTALPAHGVSAFSLILNHPGALRRMFTPPIELSVGEAFIYGDFDIDGDIFAIFALFDDLATRAFSPGDFTALVRAFLRRRILAEGTFAQRYVFPDSELVPVSDANLVAERAGFEVRDVERKREHYTLTLRHWVNRLEARQAGAIAVSDTVTYPTWRLYMAASAHSFAIGNLSVNQTLLSKPAGGKSNLPLTRADLYIHR